MNSRKARRELPPVPRWFEAPRVLAGSEVLVHCEHTHFGLHNQTVVLGQGGALLLTSLPLREGTRVELEVAGDGQWLQVEATIAHLVSGWGTVFRFPSAEGWGWRVLSTWLGGERAN